MGIERFWSGRDLRLGLIVAFFVLAAVTLVVQLFRIQFVGHERLAALAQAHQFRRLVLEPERGRIFDRDGRLLVFSTESLSLMAMRQEIEDVEGVAAALDSIGISRRTTRKRLAGESGFTWLARGLYSEARIRSIADRFAGVYARREVKRVRPLGDLARLTLGGWSPESELVSGLERRYSEELTGEPGWESLVLDAVGRRYATGAERAPRAGQDLVLTIDARIQEAAEEALDACVRAHDASGGVVLVVDPATGDVLAIANHGAADEGSGSRNRAVLDAIEVGSCAKIFAVAAALEEADCDTTTRFFCGVKPDEERPPVVRDDHGKPQSLSLQMVVAQSRNTGTARIARLVGADRLHRFLDRFGIGRRTGIDLPSESAGLLRPVEEWSGRSLETIAIGYEFSATPIQLAMAYGAVANGGLLVRPRLVRAFVDPETGRSRKVQPEIVRRVISEETARTLRAVLRRVAQPGGTGTTANVAGTTVAGKTGTARKYDPRLETYSYARHLSSFIGFAPHDEPRYVVCVVIDEPRGAYYGSEVAAPVFRRVMEKISAIDPVGVRTDVRRIRVSVEEAPEEGPGLAHAAPATDRTPGCPDLRGLSTLEARRLGARRGYRVEVLGSGERVLFQEPLRGDRTIVVSTGAETPDRIVVPDVTGLTLRDAIARLAARGLSVERAGRGRVSGQTPAPGSRVPVGETIELELRDVSRQWLTVERAS